MKRNKFSVGHGILVLIISLLCIVMLYPFWHTIITSIITSAEFASKKVLLFPSKITFEAYQHIFETGDIYDPLKVTVFITAVGTCLSVLLTTIGAYVLSKKFPFSNAILNLILITMFLYPGLIPVYINYKNLHLINSVLLYVVHTLVVPYYFIIMRTHFRNFPSEVEDAASIDGCSTLQIIFRIVIPLSMSIIATIGLFNAVMYWNTYTASLFFMIDDSKKTLQHYLMDIVKQNMDDDMAVQSAITFPDSLKAANIIVGMLPILCVYPFLQKYFVKGIMIGAVKG